MPIQLECPGCQKHIRVADEHAGKKVKCPNCRTVFQVPQPQADAPLPSFAVAPHASRPSSTPLSDAAAPPLGDAQQPMHRPTPYGATTTTAPSYGVAESDPAQTMGNIGLALGIVALVGEFGSVLFACCCGAFAFGPTLMAIPSGIGLYLSMKSTGQLRSTGMIVNGIALGIAALATIGVVILLILYGSMMFYSLSQQNQGGGF